MGSGSGSQPEIKKKEQQIEQAVMPQHETKPAAQHEKKPLPTLETPEPPVFETPEIAEVSHDS